MPPFCDLQYGSAPVGLANSDQWSTSRAPNFKLHRKAWEPLALTTFLRDTVLLFVILCLPRQPQCSIKNGATPFNLNTWQRLTSSKTGLPSRHI
jgi:hypothetical protein